MFVKKIAIAHYLTGERDGVSLEIDKRARVVQNLGYEITFITGYDGLSRSNTCVIPEMKLDNAEAVFLRDQMFLKKTITDTELQERYHTLEQTIYTSLLKQWDANRPDLFFVHNLFSHAFNLPATTAFIRILDQFNTSTVCVHHDFWFERPKFIHPTTNFVEDILKQIPPERSYIIKHQVINSLSEKALFRKRSIRAERIGDYFDFDKNVPVLSEGSEQLRSRLGIGDHDLVVLQATRITERKAIENAINYVASLQEKITDRSVWLLFPNFVEVDSHDYYARLQELGAKLHIKVLWKQDMFKHEKFWDAYLIADIVTYPSIQEGFGNQFLEAIYFHKPIVMFEYEVYRKDIKPEGYQIISLGETTTTEDGFVCVPQDSIQRAVIETLDLVSHPEKISRMTEHNFKVARTYHNETKLVEDITGIVAASNMIQ